MTQKNELVVLVFTDEDFEDHWRYYLNGEFVDILDVLSVIDGEAITTTYHQVVEFEFQKYLRDTPIARVVKRQNLAKLELYLRSLPANYDKFDMGVYMQTADERDDCGISPEKLHECGTTACAIGHGPAAGISPAGYTTWSAYCDNKLCSNDFGYLWMFHANWAGHNDSPVGVADRIRYYLDNMGVFTDSNDPINEADDLRDAYIKWRDAGISDMISLTDFLDAAK